MASIQELRGQLKQKKTAEYEGIVGWLRIFTITTLLVGIIFFSIEQITGIKIFDALSGKKSSPSAHGIIFTVILGILFLLYRIFSDCNYSFACFLLGGWSGMQEQTVDKFRYEKMSKDLRRNT